MKRSQLWSASITLMIIISMIGAYSIIGAVFGQESGSSEGGGEHRATSSEGAGEHGGSASAHTLQIPEISNLFLRFSECLPDGSASIAIVVCCRILQRNNTERISVAPPTDGRPGLTLFV